ncbi:potassium transporter, partial [Treponema pallidum]
MHIGNLTHLTMLVLCLAIRLCDQFLPFSVQFFTIVGDVGILVLVWSSLASSLNKEKYVRTFLRQYTVPVFLGLLITLLTFVRASVTLTTASGDLYTTLTHIQNITLGIFALIAFKAQKKFAERAVSNPSQTLIVSFLVVIFIGTHLLMFPGATPHSQPLPMLTALFTATSAVCVTGLSVIDVATQLSTWGKAILAALIQIGG